MRLEEFPARRVIDGRTVKASPKRDRKAWSRAYYQKNLEHRREYFRAWREEHRDELAAYHRAWRAKNKDRQHVYNTKLQRRRKRAKRYQAYYAANRERILAKNREYWLRNQERIRAQQRAAYRAEHAERPPILVRSSAQELRGGLAAPPPERNAAELRARPLTATQFFTGTNP